MSPRRKVSLVTVGTIVIVVVGIYAVGSVFILSGVNDVEAQSAKVDVNRFVGVLGTQLSFLSMKTADWAVWDDAYQFVQDGNLAFVESNLQDSLFVQLQVNVVIFTNSTGGLVYSRAYDLDTSSPVAVPTSLLSHLQASDPLFSNGSSGAVVSGVLSLPEGPLMFTSRPVLRSDGDGPVAGRVIFGRYLDSSALAQMGEVLNMSIGLVPYGGSSPADYADAAAALTSPGSTFAKVLGPETIAGYTRIDDVYGQPAYVVRVLLPRTIYLEGQKNVSTLLTALAVVALIVGGLALAFIGRSYSYRAKSEKELLESAERFRAAFEDAPIGGTMTTLEGTWFNVNNALCGMLGYSMEELVGRSYLDLIPPDGREEAARQRELLLSGKERTVGERQRFVRKDGSIMWASTGLAAVRDPSGSTLYIVASIEDITARVSAEEELKAYSAQLEEKVKERTAELEKSHIRLLAAERAATVGKMSTQLAHDLRNPLAAINTGVFYLRNAGKRQGPKIEQTFDSMEGAVSHADRILKQLIEYSRGFHFSSGPVLLQTVLKDALSLTPVPAGITVSTGLDPSAEVVGDATALLTVFENLFVNAIDAMPDGGTLAVSCQVEGGRALVAVKDSGSGIPPGDLPKIFTPFFTTKARGLGLGLAICKEIVESQGGTIAVETMPGSGTTFTVSLPLRGVPG